MQNQTHLSNEDLQLVLTGDGSKELTRLAEVHLSECDSCRNQIESLAANDDLWERAASILTTETIGETIAFSSRFNQRPSNDDLRMTEPTVGYLVEDLLQPPTHPEMLGRLEHYEIERELGRGGMGVVVKAHDKELHRTVAIKLMAPHLACYGVARQRFAREARSAAAILHPNVIAIHGVNTESNTPWLVMPYIVGPSLEDIVRQDGALEEKDVVCFAMQIAAGLQAAHAQGVVHRDIKPANVLIESGMGRVVITDFGLARAECDASMTQTGWFAGTPNFMSPEQARGVEIDHRSDLFSLGSVMYYMATGKLPFRAEQTMAVFTQIREHYPEPARRSNSSISTPISNLIEHLLSKDPEHRIQSAAEVHQVLEQYLAHLHHPDARKSPAVKTPWRPKKSNNKKKLVLLGSLASVVVMFLAWFAWTNWPWANPAESSPNFGNQFDLIVQEFELQEVEKFDAALIEAYQLTMELEAAFDRFDVIESSSMVGDSLPNELRKLDFELKSLERMLQMQSDNL